MSENYCVVIACYNDGATVEEAAQSVLDQGAQEVIVVNDGSTDPATRAVLTSMAERGIQVLHQENKGLAAARMAGVHATAADYVIALDADDRIEHGALADMARCLAAHPEVSVVYGDTILFGASTGKISISWAWDAWLCSHVNMMPGAGSMIRRDHLIADGGWVLKGGYEDWDLWMSMHENQRKAHYLKRTVLHYRQGSGRMLSGSRTRHDDIFAVLVDRHPKLFAQGTVVVPSAHVPLRLRLSFPMIDRMPLANHSLKHRLKLLAARPLRAVEVRLQRAQSALKQK